MRGWMRRRGKSRELRHGRRSFGRMPGPLATLTGLPFNPKRGGHTARVNSESSHTHSASLLSKFIKILGRTKSEDLEKTVTRGHVDRITATCNTNIKLKCSYQSVKQITEIRLHMRIRIDARLLDKTLSTISFS